MPGFVLEDYAAPHWCMADMSAMRRYWSGKTKHLPLLSGIQPSSVLFPERQLVRALCLKSDYPILYYHPVNQLNYH